MSNVFSPESKTPHRINPEVTLLTQQIARVLITGASVSVVSRDNITTNQILHYVQTQVAANFQPDNPPENTPLTFAIFDLRKPLWTTAKLENSYRGIQPNHRNRYPGHFPIFILPPDAEVATPSVLRRIEVVAGTLPALLIITHSPETYPKGLKSAMVKYQSFNLRTISSETWLNQLTLRQLPFATKNDRINFTDAVSYFLNEPLKPWQDIQFFVRSQPNHPSRPKVALFGDNLTPIIASFTGKLPYELAESLANPLHVEISQTQREPDKITVSSYLAKAEEASINFKLILPAEIKPGPRQIACEFSRAKHPIKTSLTLRFDTNGVFHGATIRQDVVGSKSSEETIELDALMKIKHAAGGKLSGFANRQLNLTSVLHDIVNLQAINEYPDLTDIVTSAAVAGLRYPESETFAKLLAILNGEQSVAWSDQPRLLSIIETVLAQPEFAPTNTTNQVSSVKILAEPEKDYTEKKSTTQKAIYAYRGQLHKGITHKMLLQKLPETDQVRFEWESDSYAKQEIVRKDQEKYGKWASMGAPPQEYIVELDRLNAKSAFLRQRIALNLMQKSLSKNKE